jgi:hypothetical protein
MNDELKSILFFNDGEGMGTEETFNQYWRKYESKIKAMITQNYAISSSFRNNLFDDLLQVARLSLYQRAHLIG